MVSLINCKGVLLDGPTFQNSPAWNIHPLLCENVIVRNLKVRNPWYSTNGDGLDIESCKNVMVYNATFDVGDDAICIKSGKGAYGRNRGVPSENIVIRDCIVYQGHGGVVVGSEMSGGVKNISVKNCQFLGTDVGVRFKSTRGRGGVVENIFISNLLMENIKTDAIRFNMFYANRSASLGGALTDDEHREIPEISEETPRFQNIKISDIICRNAGRAIYIQGLPELPLTNIEIKDVNISAKYGVVGVEAENVTLSKLNIKSEEKPTFLLHNTKKVSFSELDDSNVFNGFLELSGKKTQDISFEDVSLEQISKFIRFGEEEIRQALKN